MCDTPFCLRQHCEAGFCNTTQKVPICQCQRGFEGKYCEININECLLPDGSSPCLHDSSCIDGINRYDCDCDGTGKKIGLILIICQFLHHFILGYSGLLCEIDIDECTEKRDVCGIGQCKNLPGTYSCVCPDNKCGFNCTLDDPCLVNPCENGNCISKCTQFVDYDCFCNENWTGKNCSDKMVKSIFLQFIFTGFLNFRLPFLTTQMELMFFT